jgi:hypothetical protein
VTATANFSSAATVRCSGGDCVSRAFSKGQTANRVAITIEEFMGVYGLLRLLGLDHRFGHPLRLWETPFCAKTQRSRLMAETMVKAQSDKLIPGRPD